MVRMGEKKTGQWIHPNTDVKKTSPPIEEEVDNKMNTTGKIDVQS